MEWRSGVSLGGLSGPDAACRGADPHDDRRPR